MAEYLPALRGLLASAALNKLKMRQQSKDPLYILQQQQALQDMAIDRGRFALTKAKQNEEIRRAMSKERREEEIFPLEKAESQSLTEQRKASTSLDKAKMSTEAENLNLRKQQILTSKALADRYKMLDTSRTPTEKELEIRRIREKELSGQSLTKTESKRIKSYFKEDEDKGIMQLMVESWALYPNDDEAQRAYVASERMKLMSEDDETGGVPSNITNEFKKLLQELK